MVRIFLNFKNKKIQVLSMLTLFNLISYGTNVDDLISQYEKDSYTTKINEKSMRKYDIKDRALKNGDWNEVTVTSDNNYSLHSEANGLTSENNYNKKTNQISRNIQKITNETTKNSEIRDLIDLYKNYKNKQKAIEQEALTLEDTKKDYAIQSKKYELGTASQYDYELARTEYENSQLKYENLGRELQVLVEQFTAYNITLPEKETLDDLKKVELKKEDFYALRLSEAETIELNSQLTNEQLRKENADYKYPKLTGDVGYSLKNHSVVVGLSISKSFKRYNDTIEDLKNEADKLRLQYEQKKNELLSNAGQQMITYTTYQTNELTAQNTMNIKKKEYEIYAKKYELGVDTYSNYVEKRNNYKKAVIDYETAKNELAAFTKKIKYYK